VVIKHLWQVAVHLLAGRQGSAGPGFGLEAQVVDEQCVLGWVAVKDLVDPLDPPELSVESTVTGGGVDAVVTDAVVVDIAGRRRA
jgi:hypothetical protein